MIFHGGNKFSRFVAAAFAVLFSSVINFHPTFAEEALAITNVEVTDFSDDVVASNPTIDGMKITYGLIFHQSDDFATYRLTVKNNLSRIKVTSISDNNSSSAIDYIYNSNINKMLERGESFDFDIKIVYNGQASERDIVSDVTFRIAYIEDRPGADNEEHYANISLVPNTGVKPMQEEVSGSSITIPTSIVVAITVGLISILVLSIITLKKKAAIIVCAVVAVCGYLLVKNEATVAEKFTEQNLELDSSLKIREWINYTIHKGDDTLNDNMRYQKGATFRNLFSSYQNPVGMNVVGYKYMDGTDVNLDDKILDDFEISIIYEPKSFNVTLNVRLGEGSTTATGTYGSDVVIEGVKANSGYTIPKTLTCTNNQTATITPYGVVTIHNISADTTCTVTNTAPNFFTISFMHEMTNSICKNAKTPKNGADLYDTDGSHRYSDTYVPTTTLIDARDGNKYLVRKLADGNCWMVENLRIAGKTLTPEDSNVANDFVLPAAETADSDGNYNVIPDEHDYLKVFYDETYGAYYNWYTATVGLGTYNAYHQGGIRYSICPKGWTLPDDSGIVNGAIYNALGNLGMKSAFNIEYGGFITNKGKASNRDNFAYYTSRYDHSYTNLKPYVYYTEVSKIGYVNRPYIDKTNFLNVRCEVRVSN